MTCSLLSAMLGYVLRMQDRRPRQHVRLLLQGQGACLAHSGNYAECGWALWRCSSKDDSAHDDSCVRLSAGAGTTPSDSTPLEVECAGLLSLLRFVRLVLSGEGCATKQVARKGGADGGM